MKNEEEEYEVLASQMMGWELVVRQWDGHGRAWQSKAYSGFNVFPVGLLVRLVMLGAAIAMRYNGH